MLYENMQSSLMGVCKCSVYVYCCGYVCSFMHVYFFMTTLSYIKDVSTICLSYVHLPIYMIFMPQTPQSSLLCTLHKSRVKQRKFSIPYKKGKVARFTCFIFAISIQLLPIIREQGRQSEHWMSQRSYSENLAFMGKLKGADHQFLEPLQG